MLGHRQTRSSNHKCCRGGYVESFDTTRASAGSIDEYIVPRCNMQRALPHGFRKPRQFVNSFSFQLQSDERRGDLSVGRVAIQQRFKQVSGLSPRKILATHQASDKFRQLMLRHHSFRKLASSFFPSVVIIDSG